MMVPLRILLAALVALCVLSPRIVDAQPRAGAPAVNPKRERVKQKIRALRAYTLTEELALDEKTAAKLFPVLAKWDDGIDKLLLERADLTRRLSEVDASKDPKAIDKLIDDAVANQKAFWDVEDRRLAEVRKILTPTQTARLVLVLPQFERKIQNQIKRAIAKRRGAARFDDDDDDDTGDAYDRPHGGPRPRPPPSPAAPRGPAPSAKPRCDVFSSPYGCPK